MNDSQFLDFYNEELFYLKEIGKEFARDNPQVAQYLGMHSEEIQDPFVERLLEGTAFLSARVQQKLSNEQPGIAIQMLSRIAPLWYTPTPAMSMISIEPDLTFPQWNEDLSLKKGSPVIIKDPSLGEYGANFVTSRDIELQPVVIERATCSVVPPQYLPESIVGYFNDSLSHISISFSTKYTLPLQELKMDPFILTVTGDLVKSNLILHNIFVDSLRILLWAKSDNHVYSKEIDLSAISIFGAKQEDSCLPEAYGELPGGRLLREYLNFPAKFFSIRVDGVEDFLKQIPDSYEFEMFFIFKNRNLNLIDSVSKSNFRIFATPIVNLYKKRCDPVLLNNLNYEHHVVVDRHNPNLFKIHHLTEVVGVLPDGSDVIFSPLYMDATYDMQENRCGYSTRRRRTRNGPIIYKNNDLHADDVFITLSSGDTNIDLDQISSLSVVAYVLDRNLNPKLLQDPKLSLQKSLPITNIEMLQNPSRPVDLPAMKMAWDALQIVSENPLKYTYPNTKNNASLVKNWLYFFANKSEPAQLSKIESINEIVLKPCYTRYFGNGPITWARGLEAQVNLLSKNHSDKGAFLFGVILFHALTAYCQVNQKLNFFLSIDGNEIIKWE